MDQAADEACKIDPRETSFLKAANSGLVDSYVQITHL